MLDHEKILEKMESKSKEFEKACMENDYARARFIYGTALSAAVFMELDDKDNEKIFGSQPYRGMEDYVDGFFKRDYVLRTLHAYSGMANTFDLFDCLLQESLFRAKK